MDFQPAKESWESYAERLEYFFKASKVVDDDEKLVALINANDSAFYTLLKDLSYPESPKTMTFTDVMYTLQRHFVGIKNIFKARKLFYNAIREPRENASNWYRRLKSLAIDCDFGVFLEHILVDKFVCGFEGNILHSFYEHDENLSLIDALEIAQLHDVDDDDDDGDDDDNNNDDNETELIKNKSSDEGECDNILENCYEEKDLKQEIKPERDSTEIELLNESKQPEKSPSFWNQFSLPRELSTFACNIQNQFLRLQQLNQTPQKTQFHRTQNPKGGQNALFTKQHPQLPRHPPNSQQFSNKNFIKTNPPQVKPNYKPFNAQKNTSYSQTRPQQNHNHNNKQQLSTNKSNNSHKKPQPPQNSQSFETITTKTELTKVVTKTVTKKPTTKIETKPTASKKPTTTKVQGSTKSQNKPPSKQSTKTHSAKFQK